MLLPEHRVRLSRGEQFHRGPSVAVDSLHTQLKRVKLVLRELDWAFGVLQSDATNQRILGATNEFNRTVGTETR
eukprot:5998806-Pyramimonas_sp.AAC.1